MSYLNNPCCILSCYFVSRLWTQGTDYFFPFAGKPLQHCYHVLLSLLIFRQNKFLQSHLKGHVVYICGLSALSLLDSLQLAHLLQCTAQNWEQDKVLWMLSKAEGVKLTALLPYTLVCGLFFTACDSSLTFS